MLPRLLCTLLVLSLVLGLPLTAAEGDAGTDLTVIGCPGDDPLCLTLCDGWTLADALGDPRGAAGACLPA